jgi:hypothetical protein
MHSMKLPKLSFNLLGIALILSASLLAELYRIKGFLLLDLLAPLVLVIWIFEKIRHRGSSSSPTLRWPSTLWPALLFLGIGLASLFLFSTALSNTNFIVSAFYLVRWGSLFGLSWMVMNQTPLEQKRTWQLLVLFSSLLAIAGFVQLVFVPDFTAYEELGWDPHQGRLLSTWFDPNFVGGYLAFFTPILLGYAWDRSKARRWALPVLALIVLALALTLSRSAYLALLVGLVVFGLLRSIKLLAFGGVCLVLIGLAVSPVRDRFMSLIDSATSVTSETYTLPDASARLRYDSWRTGWTLFLDSPWLGHGYNAYKFAALDQGLIKDTEIHAASGSDSSLLTVLATTGILGFLPFISLYLLLLLQAWREQRNSFSVGFLGGLCGLLVHSIFVNSLLFPLFMAPFWISVGLLQTNHGAAESRALDQ